MSYLSAKKNLRVTTYSKVVALLLFVSFGFLLLFFCLFYFNNKQEKEYYIQSSNELKKEVDALLSLKSEAYLSLLKEVTYWDDLVEFVDKKNATWFNNSVNYLVKTNRVDYLSIYNLQNQLIKDSSNGKVDLSFEFDSDIFESLKRNNVLHFYLKKENVVYSIFGATIHPSNDPLKNKTKPHGFFFLINKVDANYLKKELEVCNADFKFFSSHEKIQKKTVYYIKQLPSFDSNVTSLVFKKKNHLNFKNTKRVLYTTLFTFFITILIFFYFANRWAKKPLLLIRNVLEKGDTKSIDSLKKIKGEIRYIGKLFERNHFQKIKLNETKRKAEESDKLKTAFLMNLSHEIRTPMNAILGFSDLLMKNGITNDERNEYLKIIQKSGQNLIDIIDDLVEMSKIDSELVKAKYSSVDLHKMLESTFESVKITVKKDIDFIFNKPDFKFEKKIVTDTVKLCQVLTNLLNNAVKFTPSGSVVFSYKVNEEANSIDFHIKDTGIGIPKKIQESIFIRFNKGDHAVDYTENNGLGLGLAISKAYIEMLDGTIKLFSKEGEGAEFIVSIPLIYDDKLISQVDSILSEDVFEFKGDNELVLVAEDDDINFLLIEKLLKQLNFSIIRAKNGLEALQIAKEKKDISLILMDIKMPIMDGHIAFTKIREFDLHIPIVAQTSYSFPEEIEKIKELGFTDYILKPLNKETFCKMMKKNLSKPCRI